MGESGRCVKSLQHIQRFSEGFRSKCEHDVSCSLSQFEPDETRRCHLGIHPCHRGEKPAHSVHSGRQLISFLGHFSWLASLISVLSKDYTAVQSRTLQFSSHCVWKYSYSTVKHIREHIFISPNVSVNSDWSSKIFILNIFPPGRWMFTTIPPGLIMCWTVLNPVQQLLSCFVSLMQANNLTHLFHDHRKCLTRGCLHQLGFK